MSDNKISEIIETSLSELKNVVDVNTIIGEPINTPQGTTIIPVSKVSLAFASGGLDYGKAENPDPKKKPISFSGGGGTGVSVTPVGFLVVGGDGNVEMLSANKDSEPNDAVSALTGLIEKSPDLISRLKEVFKKDKKKEDCSEKKAEEE